MKGRFAGRTWLALGVALVAIGVLAPLALATTELPASKTATGHWEQTYEWTIEKTVTPDVHNLETGQSGTSTYTVALTKILASESIWVDGEVCVKNIGTTASTNLAISDRIQALDASDNVIFFGPIVSVDVSSNPVLDPGESACYPYSIPFTPVAGAASYRNRAFVHAEGVESFPEAVPFTLPATPTVVNGSVNVTDTNGMSWPFSDSGSVSYTKTFTCDEDKGEHDNTATIVETGQSDSAKVTVNCVPPPDPGCTLTLGYWKQHTKYDGSKRDDTWDAIGEDTEFDSSGLSWYQLFHTAPKGSAYIILAHQYMAALLNSEAGADTSDIDATLASAAVFFDTYAIDSVLSNAVRGAATNLADALDDYNNGVTGPGHCSD